MKRLEFIFSVLFLALASCESSVPEPEPVPQIEPEPTPSEKSVVIPHYTEWAHPNVPLDHEFDDKNIIFLTVDSDCVERNFATDRYRRIYYFGFYYLEEGNYSSIDYASDTQRFRPELKDGNGKAKGEKYEQEFKDSILTYMNIDSAIVVSLIKVTPDSLYYKLRLQYKGGRNYYLHLWETVGKDNEKKCCFPAYFL